MYLTVGKKSQRLLAYKSVSIIPCWRERLEWPPQGLTVTISQVPIGEVGGGDGGRLSMGGLA